MAVAGVPTVAKKTELETKPVPAVPTVPQKNAGPTPDASPEAKKDGPDGEDNKSENKKAPNANNIDGQTRAMLKIMGLSDEQIEEILGNMPNMQIPSIGNPFAIPKGPEGQAPRTPTAGPEGNKGPNASANLMSGSTQQQQGTTPLTPEQELHNFRKANIRQQREDQRNWQRARDEVDAEEIGMNKKPDNQPDNKYDAANDEATKAEAEGLGPMKMEKDDTGPKMKGPAPQQATPKRPQPSPSMGGQ